MTQAFNLSQLANFVNSSGQLDAATGLTNTSSLGFPTGTLMLFQQTAAPTGWTKQTTHNDKVLRVVSGTASSGGTTAFSTVFANQTPTISGGSISSTTLSTAQMPSHSHSMFGGYGVAGLNTDGFNGITNSSTGSTGGGESHTHSFTQPTASAITLNVQYVDLIIASKN
jgi:hypothetical protein